MIFEINIIMLKLYIYMYIIKFIILLKGFFFYL